MFLSESKGLFRLQHHTHPFTDTREVPSPQICMVIVDIYIEGIYQLLKTSRVLVNPRSTWTCVFFMLNDKDCLDVVDVNSILVVLGKFIQVVSSTSQVARSILTEIRGRLAYNNTLQISFNWHKWPVFSTLTHIQDQSRRNCYFHEILINDYLVRPETHG